MTAAAVLGLAAVLPLFFDAGGVVLANMVLAAAYVIMALGLNVVVGFAGLLDLGYVAFFAIGAHVAAYFGSAFWANAGGGAGIAGIDRIDLPLVGRFDALDLRPWYWFALALVALMLFVKVRLRDSRVGRAWIALRDDEDAAASAGVPIVRTKLL